MGLLFIDPTGLPFWLINRLWRRGGVVSPEPLAGIVPEAALLLLDGAAGTPVALIWGQ